MSESEPRKQTLSFLHQRFREVGIRPRTKLGQNFLIDQNLLNVLLQAAELAPADVVLEVGTGTGALTELMAPSVAAVVTVEVDGQLFQLAGEELHRHANVTMLHTDALAGKHHIRAEVLEAVYAALDAAPDRRFKLVANLPYNIATPLIMNLLSLPRPPQLMTLTIQKEVADRIVAQPRSKDYGALSIWVQSQCRVELVRVLGPTVFWPRPKVSSAIVRITADAELRGRISDPVFFHGFIRSVFIHRRKFLRSALLGVWKDRFDKPGVDRLMERLGLSAQCRAEELDVSSMLALAEAVRAMPAFPSQHSE